MVSIAYDGTQASLAARVHYDQDGTDIIRDITINFIDIKNTLTPDQQIVYTKLGTIINQIPNTTEQDNYLR
ncbi:MAG: hypothetical protein H6766_06005 [Candidatus Peribacteria bacterium]|nr:MAG: hypothetical protein H6766_06005 [Candidatus Peribacteria bacterium]